VYDSRWQYIRVATWLCHEHRWVSDRGSSSDHGSFQKLSVWSYQGRSSEGRNRGTFPLLYIKNNYTLYWLNCITHDEKCHDRLNAQTNICVDIQVYSAREYIHHPNFDKRSIPSQSSHHTVMFATLSLTLPHVAVCIKLSRVWLIIHYVNFQIRCPGLLIDS